MRTSVSVGNRSNCFKQKKKTNDNEPLNKTESLLANPQNQNLGCQDLFGKKQRSNKSDIKDLVIGLDIDSILISSFLSVIN